MFLRLALRYRLWQSCVLAGVSLLIVACAAFGPWLARAVEQTVTTDALTERRFDTAWAFSARLQPATDTPRATPPEDLDGLLPTHLTSSFEPFVHGMRSAIGWVGQGTLAWRDDFCQHITITRGRCPTKRYEVAVSEADVQNHGVRLGQQFAARAEEYSGGGSLIITGIYRADGQAPYWFGASPVGRSIHIPEKVANTDFVFTPRETFDQGEWGHVSTAETAPLPGKIRADDLQGLLRTAEQVAQRALDDEYGAALDTRLSTVVDDITAERGRATKIIPLVMVQVALFGLIVLALVVAALCDQRRAEIAVSRLRGSTQREAGRDVAIELAGPVLAGTAGGLLVAFGMITVARRTWLAGGAPPELPWTVLAATAAAALAGMITIVLAVRTTVRQPISALLRTVPPRQRGRRLGLADITVIVLAAAGLVTAVTGDGRGPLPILTPSLLSLAVGLAFAHLLIPVAGRYGPRAFRRGRLGLGLAALQAARRPALTRIVAVVAVATALVGFAGQATAVGDRNRDLRTGYETGAAAILETDSPDVRRLLSALSTIDPDRRWLTPVALVRPPAPEGLGAMLVESASFQKIAYGADTITDPTGFEQLTAAAKPIEFRGNRLQVTVTPLEIEQVALPTADGSAPIHHPDAERVTPVATIVAANGSRRFVRFDPVPLTEGRASTVDTFVGCDRPCRLLRLGIARELGDVAGIEGTLQFAGLRTDVQARLPLGTPADWSTLPSAALVEESIAPLPGPGLRIVLTSHGNELSLQHRFAPAPAAAVVSRDHQLVQNPTVPGVDGAAIPIRPAAPTTGPIPRFLRHTAVLDLDLALRWGGLVDPKNTSTEIWLNEAGAARSGEILAALTKAGFPAKLVDRRADHEARYGKTASTLALRLTPVVGLTGWLLAITVLMLMVVMSWRARAHDYASLRITGVPDSATAQAARWEQTVPVLLAALLGSACGVIGAKVALPLIPLFPTEEPEIPLDLSTAWPVALGLWLASTALLTTATVVLGSGVHRRAVYLRIREAVT